MTTLLPRHQRCAYCGCWLTRGPRGTYRHRPGAGARCRATRPTYRQPPQPCLYCGLPTDGLGELCLSCGLKRESELESVA